ncbi:MAG TPA: PEP-utilizing enzyme [Jatrophihabitans sp.]|jgi:pyruvate,water dikinase|uniref:PEP-utilizing enzyme n=1 Tax=Jatrophihabitans sp. TaxID=1932789 RepID=UPI002EEA0DD4
MSKLNKIRLVALDSDGVLLNDTYSPVIERFVTKHGGEYTAAVERGVWGSPQLAAGQNMALACRLPWSGKETIAAFFRERDEYLKEHPIQVMPGAAELLATLREAGVRVTCYGGRNREYTFDKYLGHLREFFDAEIPYVDVNDFRPGMREIVRDIFGYDFDEVLFVDDINRVAEVSKALGAGFLGVPASMAHNFQRAEMAATGVRHTVDDIRQIDLALLRRLDDELAAGALWQEPGGSAQPQAAGAGQLSERSAGSAEPPRFAFFHEVPPPAGGEGWESMYPYYLIPSEETRAEETSRLWFADTMHWSRGTHPLGSVVAEAAYFGAAQSSTRIFSLPASLGLDVRVQHGYLYISPIAVSDPDEIARRVEHFQERAGFYYQNWDSLYARWKDKVVALVDDMRTVSFAPLPEYEPMEVVTEARGRSTAWEVIADYHRLMDDLFVVWQHHFEFLNLGYGGYIVFFQFCKEAFPEISEQLIARMVAGIDILAFRPDEELRTLARLACELGVHDLIVGDDPEKTFAALAGTADGQKWQQAYDTAKDPWFNYFAEYGFTHDQDTWLSNPAIPLTGIARYIGRLQAGEEIERPVARLLAERDEIVAEYRSLLTDEEAVQFDELLGLSRQVYPYIEEHNIYIEHWAHSVFWHKLWELGDFLVASGFTRQRDDVFFFNRFELEQVLHDIVQSWAIGVPQRGVQRWAAEIDRRRPIVAALQAANPLPAYGPAPEEVVDPFAIMNYGVTTERVAAWLGLDQDGGAADNLTGIGASPGVVEGSVRLLRSERDLGDLRPGEVLVCPITAPSWGPAFSVAAGVVTDIGGMMSHAAIVCREYGLPAVVGTGFATMRLQTGDRVRLDGTTGEVVVLSAAAGQAV